MQNKYLPEEKVNKILKAHNVSNGLIYAINNIPFVEVIPVEWIVNWMNRKYGFEHSTCVKLLSDWEKENN